MRGPGSLGESQSYQVSPSRGYKGECKRCGSERGNWPHPRAIPARGWSGISPSLTRPADRQWAGKCGNCGPRRTSSGPGGRATSMSIRELILVLWPAPGRVTPAEDAGRAPAIQPDPRLLTMQRAGPAPEVVARRVQSQVCPAGTARDARPVAPTDCPLASCNDNSRLTVPGPATDPAAVLTPPETTQVPGVGFGP